MKTAILIFSLMAHVISGFCVDSAPVKLTAIEFKEKRASFEITLKEDEKIFTTLAEGERETSANLEVIRIDRPKGQVEVRFENQPMTLTLAKPPVAGKTPAFNVQGMALEQLLWFYSRQINRTLLHPATLPKERFTIEAVEGASREDIAKIMEQALVEKGLATQLCGEKFCFVVRKKDLSRLPEIVALQTNHVLHVKNAADTEANMEFNFPAVPLEQAVAQYGHLVHRKPERGGQLPGRLLITFRSQSLLTKEESRFALEALFALSNCKVVFVGNDFLKIQQPFSAAKE